MSCCLQCKSKECVSLRRKCRKIFSQDITKNNIDTNKLFWKIVKSFLTNKNCHL